MRMYVSTSLSMRKFSISIDDFVTTLQQCSKSDSRVSHLCKSSSLGTILQDVFTK
jgi:uncharacterized membrane protein YidH (DUF202 family)